MKTRILAIAAVILLAAGAGGCATTTTSNLLLTPVSGGESGTGTATFGDLSQDPLFEVFLNGKYYSGKMSCVSGETESLSAISECSIPMRAGGHTLLCEYTSVVKSILAGGGGGVRDSKCRDSDGKVYALSFSN